MLFHFNNVPKLRIGINNLQKYTDPLSNPCKDHGCFDLNTT